MKKGKTRKLTRRILSFVLTTALVVGLMPGNILTVSAEGTDTVISDELIVESVSSNDATSTTECTCGTDDSAFHATNCPAYIAPENPQCYCAEKCTEDTLNVWCDVCGVQGVSACQGTDTAATYAEIPDFSDAKVLTAVDGALCIDGEALTINTTQLGNTYVIIPEGNYKLTGDIATDTSMRTEGSINLDLNGYMWDMSAKYLTINDNVTLSLYDTSVNKTGKITTSSQVCTIYLNGSGSTFNLYSGTVENTSDRVNAKGVSSDYGSSNLYGGTIKSNAYAVFYYLSQDITINIDNTSFDCGDGYAQISASLNSDYEPCAVIDVSDYTGGVLTVDAKIYKAAVIKFFTGIQSAQDAENYKVNVRFDDNDDFFKEKEEYEEDGGNKYVYVSVPSFTTQPTEENGYTVAFNHPDATLQWCEATVYDSATYSEEDGEPHKSYVVNAGDTLIVSVSECSDDFYVNFNCSYNEETLSMRLYSSRKTASVTFDSEGIVNVHCHISPRGTGEYKIEHVRYTELEGENGVQLSKPECETTYGCKATVGEREYYSDEVTIEQEHSYTCTATSDNVITKECDICGKVGGTLTITAEGGVYDGTTAYGATVEKTGILENADVTVNYYKGNTSIGTGAPVDAGTYTAKITYEDVTASCQFTIEKADSVISAAPTPIAYLEYDGTAHNLINAGTATGGEMQYSLDGTNYLSAIPTGTDAKTYTVWYKVDGDENHNDTTPASIEVTIAPKTVEIISVTASDRVFDGTNTVEISEVIIEGILVEDEDKVSVSATATIDSINAGEYSTVDLSNITLTGSANYSIAESAENVPLTTAVTISKADAPTLPSGSKAYVYSKGYEGESVSITGLPTDCGEVEYSLLSVSSDMFENLSVDSRNGKIAYDVKELDSYTEDLQGTIDVNVEMVNYETAFYTLTITRRDKYAVTVKDGMSVSLETNELIYGQRLGELAFNEVTFVGEAEEVVDGTLKWEDSNEVPDVATDKASWRFIPDSDAYKEVVGTLDITVKQAPLEVEAVPVVTDRTYDPSVTLESVVLSGGTVKDAYGETIEGTWSWVNSDTVPTVGNAGYEAVFTPVDANYETVTKTIMVTVTKATPDIGTVSVLDAELENTTDISTVVLKRTDESMAGTLELTAEALLYGAHGYVWKFTPQDLNNYELLTGTVAIEVKDTIAPVASYKIGTGDWESFGTSTTYETFSKEELSVQIKAEDSGSGIATVQYFLAFGVIPNVSDIPAWTDYTEAIILDVSRTYVVYVKVTDKSGNEVILNSEGIVIYEDSVITTDLADYTYKSNKDITFEMDAKGNTFATLKDSEGNEVNAKYYTVTDNSKITFKAAYLDTLKVASKPYTYKIYMNPQDVETTKTELSYEISINVLAKELSVTGATAIGRTYEKGNTSVEITEVALSGIVDADEVSVDMTGLNGTLSSANAGDYTEVTLPELKLSGEDKDNYVLTQSSKAVPTNVTISPQATGTAQNVTKKYLFSQENADTINLVSLLPEDCGTVVSYGTPDVSGNVTYKVAPSIEEGTLVYTVADGSEEIVGNNGTITIDVKTQNYTSVPITISVEVVKQIPVMQQTEVTLKDESQKLTYGQKLSVLELAEVVFKGDDGETVTGTLQWKNVTAFRRLIQRRQHGSLYRLQAIMISMQQQKENLQLVLFRQHRK